MISLPPSLRTPQRIIIEGGITLELVECERDPKAGDGVIQRVPGAASQP